MSSIHTCLGGSAIYLDCKACMENLKEYQDKVVMECSKLMVNDLEEMLIRKINGSWSN